MTRPCRKTFIFPQKNKRTSGQTGHKNSEQQILSRVIKAMEKKKQDKWFEFYSAYPQSTSWIFNDITNGVTEGTSTSQRIGMSIRLLRLSVRLTVTVADATNVVRVVFFRWKVSDTSDAPGASEIFAPTGLGSNSVEAPYLPLKPSRYQIIRDMTFCLATNWKPVQVATLEIPLNWVTEFDVGVNTGKDHFYVATCSDSSTSTHPSLIHEYVLHYHDTE